MPSVSIEQNRAMHAAAEGNSTLGIPKSVGQEFVAADHGTKVGNLPKRKDPPGKSKGHHTVGAQHAEKAKAAFQRGDHATAMKHLGHALRAGLNAQQGVPGGVSASPSSGSSAVTSAADGPGATDAGESAEAGLDDNDQDDASGTSSQAIAMPVQPASHYFGQVGPKATPKAAPHVAPAGQLGATNHQPSGGFNKARFAGLRGR